MLAMITQGHFNCSQHLQKLRCWILLHRLDTLLAQELPKQTPYKRPLVVIQNYRMCTQIRLQENWLQIISMNLIVALCLSIREERSPCKIWLLVSWKHNKILSSKGKGTTWHNHSSWRKSFDHQGSKSRDKKLTHSMMLILWAIFCKINKEKKSS